MCVLTNIRIHLASAGVSVLAGFGFGLLGFFPFGCFFFLMGPVAEKIIFVANWLSIFKVVNI